MKQHLILLCVTLISFYSTSTLAVDTFPEIRFIQLSTNQKTLTIPADALVINNGVTGVYVLHNKQARFRMVRASETRFNIIRSSKTKAKRIEIFSGLFGKEIIIAGNIDALYDGYAFKGDDK